MHVLIISNGYPTNYSPLDGIFYKDQAEALSSNGFKVGFIAINPVSIKSILQQKKINFGLSNFEEKGVNTYLYKYINIPKRPTYCVKKARLVGPKIFEQYLKKHGKPDIIHLHCFEPILFAMEIKEKYKVPFVITEHSSRFMNNTIPFSMEKYVKLAFSNSNQNISVSENFTKLLINKYGSSFIYVPNIIDTDFYRPEEDSTNKSEFSFLSAGILNDNKNHTLLIQAFMLFLSTGKKAKLVIAGDGPNRGKLRAQAKELGLEKEITFTGWVSRKKLKELMNTSSTFILPSKKETFGVVLAEAMSCGIPVISTKSGGPQSIITSDKIGLLCDNNKENLFFAMQKVYDNFTSYKPSVIRQEVEDTYSQKAVSTQLLSIYKNVLQKNG